MLVSRRALEGPIPILLALVIAPVLPPLLHASSRNRQRLPSATLRMVERTNDPSPSLLPRFLLGSYHGDVRIILKPDGGQSHCPTCIRAIPLIRKPLPLSTCLHPPYAATFNCQDMRASPLRSQYRTLRAPRTYSGGKGGAYASHFQSRPPAR